MNNPLLHNRKTQIFDDLQHRTSHYNRILRAKSLYPASPKHRISLVNHLDCKYSHNIREQRKNANKKLIKSLIQIDQRKNRIFEPLSMEKKSMKSGQSVRQVRNKIAEQNFSLAWNRFSEIMEGKRGKEQKIQEFTQKQTISISRYRQIILWSFYKATHQPIKLFEGRFRGKQQKSQKISKTLYLTNIKAIIPFLMESIKLIYIKYLQFIHNLINSFFRFISKTFKVDFQVEGQRSKNELKCDNHRYRGEKLAAKKELTQVQQIRNGTNDVVFDTFRQQKYQLRICKVNQGISGKKQVIKFRNRTLKFNKQKAMQMIKPRLKEQKQSQKKQTILTKQYTSVYRRQNKMRKGKLPLSVFLSNKKNGMQQVQQKN